MVQRRAVVAAACAVLVLPAAATAAGPPSTLVLPDPAGDAGALNDQGEGLVTDVRGPVSFPQADLTRLALAPLRGRVRGFSVTFTLLETPGPVLPTAGEQTTYALVLQPTPDCRLSVEANVRGEFPATAALAVGNGCDTPFRRVPLRVVATGTSLAVAVPYAVAPRAVRPGERLDQYYAYTSTGVLDVDTLHPRSDYVLPR